jgi:hypothetical protein
VTRHTIPETFPSHIAHAVRNDYPALAVQEAGVGFLKADLLSISDPLQIPAIRSLTSRGLSLAATLIWSCECTGIGDHDVPWSLVDHLELRLPDGRLSREATIFAKRLNRRHGLTIGVSPIFNSSPSADQLHPRPRLAYTFDEANELYSASVSLKCPIQRIVIDEASFRASEAACVAWQPDVHVPAPEACDSAATVRLIDIIFKAATRPGCRLYIDSLHTLDRTMDLHPGLIDMMHNPTPAHNVLRMVNSILYHDIEERFQLVDDGDIESSRRRLRLAMPGSSMSPGATCYRLWSGTVSTEPTRSITEPSILEFISAER